MGQSMPDEPHEYGNDCALKFDAGETPKYLYARFISMVQCPGAALLPPNDRMFKLTQAPGAPCLWEYDTATWYVWMEFIAFPVGTRLHILHRPSGDNYFTDLVDEYIDEGYVFTSEYAVCGAQVGAIGGIGVITWTHQATDLLEAINITRGDDLFLELFPLPDGKLVYKFCRIAESINIKILLESP